MNQLLEAVELAARIGGGPAVTYRVPEGAQVLLDGRYDGSHILAGATLAIWAGQE